MSDTGSRRPLLGIELETCQHKKEQPFSNGNIRSCIYNTEERQEIKSLDIGQTLPHEQNVATHMKNCTMWCNLIHRFSHCPPRYQFDSQSLCDKVWLEFDEEIFINRGEETIDNNNGELF